MTTYKKNTEVYDELLSVIRRQVEAKDLTLPPETVLSAQLGTCRMTLRKVLARAEEAELIVRRNKRTVIIDRQPSLRECGMIVFNAAGIGGNTFRHYALERLFLKLSAEVRALDGEIQLLLDDEQSDPDLQLHILQHAGVILFSEPFRNPQVNAYFNSVRFGKKNVIQLLDELKNPINLVALDNHEIGRIAARALLKAGVKKLLFLSSSPQSLAHCHRLEGCREVWLGAGMQEPLWMLNKQDIHLTDYSLRCRQAMPELLQAGVDGIFASSDEALDVSLFDLFNQGLIPSRVKLMTVNGCGLAMRHIPAISCCSHGTDGIVQELVYELQLIASGNFVSPVRKLIVPKFYDNRTV